ncbi:MAG: hypothetical protein JO228_15040 [Xanthobacteraceae bacterium]|nr:hypothetical protein [Xanthobacteraceae bacterium]
MHGRAQGWVGWRRLTAGLLVFALFMHGVAFAMASSRLNVEPTGAPDWAGFELCRHDAGAPNQPDQPAADTHCVFCVAGSGFVLEPPLAAFTPFHPVEIALAPWPMMAWRLAPATVDPSARPRGPPTAA